MANLNLQGVKINVNGVVATIQFVANGIVYVQSEGDCHLRALPIADVICCGLELYYSDKKCHKNSGFRCLLNCFNCHQEFLETDTIDWQRRDAVSDVVEAGP